MEYFLRNSYFLETWCFESDKLPWRRAIIYQCLPFEVRFCFVRPEEMSVIVALFFGNSGEVIIICVLPL